MSRKVAIYVRVSTTNQAEEGYSVQEQQNALNKYAEAMGWTVYKEYVDAGFSGGKLERPAINNLINDSKMKTFDTVLVYKLDRLSRSVRDTLYLIRDIFQKNGIQFISLQESIDTSSPVGNFFLTQLSAIAEFERDQITERMNMGRLGRARSGKPMMWTRPAFGYRYDKKTGELHINESEGNIVREIYKMYLEGTSITKLRDYLNENHREGRSKEWSYRIIRNILGNPVYIGFNRFKGELYKGNHETLIDPEIFEMTQRELKKRQKQAYEQKNNSRPFQSKYMLSGIVKCGYCGAPLVARLGTRRKDGSRTIRYECYNRYPQKSKRVTTYNDDKKCKSGFYYLLDLEEHVLDRLNKLRTNPEEVLNQTSEKDVQFDKELKSREIKQIQSKIEKLNNLYLIDNISLEDLQSKTQELISRKNELLRELEVDSDVSNRKKRLEEVLNFEDIYSVDYEHQKFIVNSLIDRVKVHADAIEILWNI